MPVEALTRIEPAKTVTKEMDAAAGRREGTLLFSNRRSVPFQIATAIDQISAVPSLIFKVQNDIMEPAHDAHKNVLLGNEQGHLQSKQAAATAATNARADPHVFRTVPRTDEPVGRGLHRIEQETDTERERTDGK